MNDKQYARSEIMSTAESQPENPEDPAAAQDLAQRLARARVVIEAAETHVSASAKKILKSRALALAQEPDQLASATEYIEVVEFLLAHEHYAIECRHIREIHPLERLTPLPCTPSFVLGIINLRGEMLSIIDIKKFFDLPEQGLTDLNKVIVLQSEHMIFGVLADAIIGVRHISTADIQSGPPTLKGVREAYLRGVTSAQTVILDAEKILSDPKIIVHETVNG
jgi:purine-binding chemotaxis protein CheW